MTWLYLPQDLLSAPPPADLNSESSLCLETATAASATWKTKSMPPQRWSKEWTKAAWLRRLSGMTLDPSTASRGVERLISSLRDSLASRTPTPANAETSVMTETYGPMWPELFQKFSPIRSSLKTFLESNATTTRRSDPTYSEWDTKLRRASSRRPRWERTNVGTGSLPWPTPDVAVSAPQSNSNAKQWGEYRTTEKAAQATMLGLWPTPDTNTSSRSNHHQGEQRQSF